MVAAVTLWRDNTGVNHLLLVQQAAYDPDSDVSLMSTYQTKEAGHIVNLIPDYQLRDEHCDGNEFITFQHHAERHTLYPFRHESFYMFMHRRPTLPEALQIYPDFKYLVEQPEYPWDGSLFYLPTSDTSHYPNSWRPSHHFGLTLGERDAGGPSTEPPYFHGNSTTSGTY